jgi:hypothetical protein
MIEHNHFLLDRNYIVFNTGTIFKGNWRPSFFGGIAFKQGTPTFFLGKGQFQNDKQVCNYCPCCVVN